METTTSPRRSILRLFGALTGDIRMLFRQEVQLAKTEVVENLSRFGRNAAGLAIGGFVAYAGLIVFLIGLGWLLAWLLQKAGLDPTLAAFVGLAGIGLLVSLVGVVLLVKGLKSISHESLVPQRTLHTLQELKNGPREYVPESEAQPEPQVSSQEIQARVEATEVRMGQTLDELGERLSPSHINAQVKQRIQANPYRSSLLAMGAGLLSALLLRRRAHRA